jgi:hypothetical protein
MPAIAHYTQNEPPVHRPVRSVQHEGSALEEKGYSVGEILQRAQHVEIASCAVGSPFG